MSVPLHLVTGFLGSGKTSFVKHYLEIFGDKKKIAIIQNEFSPVNIDGREIQQIGDYQILEINNGSVFCVCLLGSFIESLASFVDEVKPDEIIMEASGMSDPIGVGQIFQSEKLRGKVFLGHVWSVVDAQNFFRASALKNRLEHQMRVADTIIINKLDRLAKETDEVVKEVKKINPFATVLQGTYARVDLSEMKKALNVFPQVEGQSAGRPDLESVVVKSNMEISRHWLQRFLDEINNDIIRCKGYVKIKNGKACFVQGVFDEYRIESVQSVPDPTELVIIGKLINEHFYQSRFEKFCKQ